MRKPKTITERIERAFDFKKLRRVCEMDEAAFAKAYDMTTTQIDPRERRWSTPGDDFFHFRDNGSSVLAVAHLDTVVPNYQRVCTMVDTPDGPVIHSGALDDRLGAYIILELLPALGITYDVLLTTGEESGASTAEFFEASKDYDWIIEFDRGGTDVVLYQYEDDEIRNAVEDSGAFVSRGIFSDISYMEHLGVKGINWGVGYQDYHGPRSHAYLNDTFKMVRHYLAFHRDNAGRAFPHIPEPQGWGSGWSRDEDPYAQERDWLEDQIGAQHIHDHDRAHGDDAGATSLWNNG